MKGKVLSIITAVLFGATMVAPPIVMAAGDRPRGRRHGGEGADKEEPAKKKTTKSGKESHKKKATKKASKKKAAQKPQLKKRNSFGEHYSASLRDRRKSGLCKTCRSIRNRRQVLFFCGKGLAQAIFSGSAIC